jgi:hypothetical protein
MDGAIFVRSGVVEVVGGGGRSGDVEAMTFMNLTIV